MNHDGGKGQPRRDLKVEQAAGRRGDFLVFYRRDDKAYYDAIWGASEKKALDNFYAAADELGWAVSEVSIEPRIAP